MMNTNIQSSHTENECPSTNAMEQAALLKARTAVARWRYREQYVPAGTEPDGAKARWYAQVEQRLCDWISGGGFAREDGGEREQVTEQTFVD